MLRKKTPLAVIPVAIVCLFLAAGCSDGPASPSGGDSADDHVYADLSAAFGVHADGCTAAFAAPDSTASLVTVGDTTTFTFSGYSSATYPGILMSGTFTEVTTSSTQSGTLSFTGPNADVTQLVFNNVVASSAGTITAHFSDGTDWVYDYATSSFTKI
jgi:hypothetical protein